MGIFFNINGIILLFDNKVFRNQEKILANIYNGGIQRFKNINYA